MVLISNGVMPPKADVFSVSDLIKSVKMAVENSHLEVCVVGEVSSFKPWRSGHWYFDLKDDAALVPAVMFKPSAGRVQFQVKDGLQVFCVGRVSVYAPQSKIQLIVEHMEPVGQGALALAFEQLKQKLTTEGLFDPKHKKPLPKLPKIVGIVTSPQGAALQDMLRVMRERWPGIHVLLAPCLVQGESAPAQIVQCIKRLDEKCDVMIVGRGGGSLEDLWAFNDEQVARTIFACKTPVVSAVGHETDFSIADFVADVRAATPTHAAQMVVPNVKDLLAHLDMAGHRLNRCLKMALATPKIKLDNLSQRMAKALLHKQERVKVTLARLTASLHALSPLGVLGRGFSVVSIRDEDGTLTKVVSQVEDVLPQTKVQVRVRNGSFDAQVI